MQIRLSFVLAICLSFLTGCQTNKVTSSKKSVSQVMHGFMSERKLKHCFGRTAEIVDAMSGRAEIDLSGLGIDDACLASLSPWLSEQKSLQKLNVSNNKLSDEGLINLLLDLEGIPITSLELRKNHITDASASALGAFFKRHSSLNTLNLADNDLGDRGVCVLTHHLSQRPALQSLKLSRVGMQAKGANCVFALIHNQALPHVLFLGSNHLAGWVLAEDRQTDALLTSLHIDNCNLDDQGGDSLAALLPYLQSLNTLNTSDNPFSNESVSMLSQAVLAHGALNHWNMQYSVLSDQAEAQLLKLTKLKSSLTVIY